MMEESSEAHMETDVSSTTDDVPESREVSASHKHVEMVIVVESVKEEDSTSKEIEDKTMTVDVVTSASSGEKSPQNELQTQAVEMTSPTKTNVLDSEKSPSKACDPNLTKSDVSSPMKTPSKLDISSPTKSPSKPDALSPTKSLSTVDVSSLTKSPSSVDLSSATTSPSKVDVSSPTKSPSNTKAPSPIKISPTKKDTPIKVVSNVSPVKEMEKVPNEQQQAVDSTKNDTEPTPSGKELIESVSPIKKATGNIESIKIIIRPPVKQNKGTEKCVPKNIELAEKALKQELIEQSKTSPSKKIDVNEGKKMKTNKVSPSKETVDTPVSTLSTNSTEKLPAANEQEEDLGKTETTPEQMAIDLEKEVSNSQSSDVSEKEHNKSISRELKSLINSAKESKIINECRQVTSKTRKSRGNPDSSNTSLNTSVDPEKVQNKRRASSNSQKSSCSEKSDKGLKRSMRSQNPEFVSKCKQFLHSVTAKVMKDSGESMSEDETDKKEKEQPVTPKRKKVTDQVDRSNKLRSDPYCWRCHYIVEQEENDKAHPPVMCTVCPRSFHYKCLSSNERKITPEKNWVCPDCLQILQAETSDSRSPAMKKITLGMLCELLKYALDRMMELNGVEPFIRPVDRTSFPDYDKYVVHPMDLTQMKQNIADGHYGSTEAFIADTQWILHNSIIFNTLQSKLTAGARSLFRSCKAEMGEIEACPECYAGAHARRSTWFTDVCSTPHILLWAKLKGFPYWPAKAMTVNSSGLVDVRFFGAHDRAWVPAKDCFLYSEKDPNNFRNKRQDILDSMQEAEQHIRNISRKYGKFVYPPFRTQFDPSKLAEQLKMMIPSFEGEIKSPLKEKSHSNSPIITKYKRRSNSKSSKSSANEGEISECDDSNSSKKVDIQTKDKEESAKMDIDSSENDKTIEIDIPPTKEIEVPSRKRRRSNLEEAVLTVMEPIPAKRKKSSEKVDSQAEPGKEDKKKSDKEASVTESKKNTPKTKAKDNEPTSSTVEDKESLRVTPIKLVALPRTNKLTPKQFITTKVTSKPNTPEDKTPKIKQTKEKTPNDKVEEKKSQKRRNSRHKSSTNSTSSPKIDKNAEKSSEVSTSKEVKTKEAKKRDSDAGKTDRSLLKATTESPKDKEKGGVDDDISLAVIAREGKSTTHTGLPTISSVRSLSTVAHNTNTTITKITAGPKTTEVTIEANSDSSIFTPTSTDSVRNMKDAEAKLQKLRSDAEPMVGRVGVKAFARMTSPNRNDKVEVEIKAEPIDLNETDEERQMEKMDLMNACKLRPVSQVPKLRDVRINKIVVAPPVVKKPVKTVEVRPRAKKTFPQPKRLEEGRSELNGKNSMVYIPIQPPITQAPVRPTRPGANGPTSQIGTRPIAPISSANNVVNTVTPPLRPTLTSPSTITTTNAGVANTSLSTVGSANVAHGPTVGQMATTVHTVPLMTSVNGQWMFSLQPVMSVGSLENSGSPPVVNGLGDRTAPAILSVTPTNQRNDTTPAEMPRLQQRPALIHPLDTNAPVNSMPPPSTAGPLTAKLNQNAVKLSDFFRTLLEDTIERLDEPAAHVTLLKQQLEYAKWQHRQEVDEMKHNHELTLAEMRLSFEKEKQRVVLEARRTAQVELEAAVRLAKSKQWCASCKQEAQFYCCWNTAYCDYACQRAHWPQHFAACMQQRSQEAENNQDNQSETGTQGQTDSLPKSAPTQTPTLTVGGKINTTRVFSGDPANVTQKSSIIVSMVEDNSGNQTMKCVGTYKSPTQTTISPLIINKQIINNEETAKKVVTSGGYLIVGASGNSSVITPAPTVARNSRTIQYFT